MSLRLCTEYLSITVMHIRGCRSSMSNFIHTRSECFFPIVFLWFFYPKILLSMIKVKNDFQIFRGLAYIHTVPGICHRDVKPQNLLVSCPIFAFLDKVVHFSEVSEHIFICRLILSPIRSSSFIYL